MYEGGRGKEREREAGKEKEMEVLVKLRMRNIFERNYYDDNVKLKLLGD